MSSRGVGAAMAGGNPSAGRQNDDWYPTPPDVTNALLRVLSMQGAIWEPCCGDGAMARVITAHGYDVFATDLVPRGYGDGHGERWDVMRVSALPAPNVVTNPPFKLAAPIIEHVLALGPEVLALLLKATYWHAKTRLPLFRRHPPSRVLPLTWRPDFLGLSNPTMDVAWCVWERRSVGATLYEPLEKPMAT